MNKNEYYDRNPDNIDTFVLKRHEHSPYYAHVHSAIEIYYVLSGSIKAIVNGQTVIAKTNEMIVCNSYETHSYYWIQESEVYVLIMSQKYLADFYEKYPNKQFAHHLDDPVFNLKIKEILDSIPPSYKNSKLSYLRRKAYANYIFSLIIENYGVVNFNQSTNFIYDIFQYIFSHYNEDITLESCAKHFNYATNSFSRIFSRYIGVDFRTFINNIRAESADVLIADNKDKTMLEIASRCGFNSEATFYRAYKRRFGIPPKKKSKTNQKPNN